MMVIGIKATPRTGFAVYDTLAKELVTIKTLQLHQAMSEVFVLKQNKLNVFVRLSKFKTRDCTIWQEFLTDNDIPFELVPLKRPIDYIEFRRVTGYKTTTSEHGRDAAMLAFQFKAVKCT